MTDNLNIANVNDDIVGVCKQYRDLLKNTVIRSDESLEKANPIFELINSMRRRELFRYRPCDDNNFDALLNDKMYFSIPKKFNDPHDCLSYVDKDQIASLLSYGEMRGFIDKLFNLYTRRRQGENLESANVSEEDVQGMLNLFENMGEFEADSIEKMFSQYVQYSHSENLKASREKTYIACLSQTLSSTLMWAHYADYHKGFALEYDSNTLRECLLRHNILLCPITYGDERYDATEHEIDMLKIRVEHGTDFYESDELFYIKSNIYKGSEWKYEKEWRAFCFSPQGKPCVTVKPTAIYLGSQMLEDNKKKVFESVKGKEIRIYEMYIDENEKEYKLSYKPVN
jgi:hypothetical protein